MCRCALKNEIYNNSCYSYSNKWQGIYSAVKPNYYMVTNLNLLVSQYDLLTIGPLQLTFQFHVVQNRHDGEQNYDAFCLAPVRLLLSSKPVCST